MKKSIGTLLITALFAGLVTSAVAQRTREARGGNSRPEVSRSTHYNNSAPVRSFTRRDAPSRSFSNNGNNNRNNTVYRQPERSGTRVMRGNSNYDNSTQRTIASRDGYTMRGRSADNYNRYDRYTRPYRINTSYRNNYYHTNNYYYGNVYGHRTRFMYGTRYRVIPHSFISIHFGGHPYYYNDGYYYGFYRGYYCPIFPPFGLRINVLPVGFVRIFIGSYPFFYYNGIYYRQYENYYEVVDAPMGAIVSSLPVGARSVIINGEQLYELNGTYYRADRDSNGNYIYTVIGKNGVVNNTPLSNYDDQQPPVSLDQTPQLKEGDVINDLPEGSKIVTINGQQLYETPDNIYLQEIPNNGGVVYKVVGK